LSGNSAGRGIDALTVAHVRAALVGGGFGGSGFSRDCPGAPILVGVASAATAPVNLSDRPWRLSRLKPLPQEPLASGVLGRGWLSRLKPLPQERLALGVLGRVQLSRLKPLPQERLASGELDGVRLSRLKRLSQEAAGFVRCITFASPQCRQWMTCSPDCGRFNAIRVGSGSICHLNCNRHW
jgi:hypothetical protein